MEFAGTLQNILVCRVKIVISGVPSLRRDFIITVKSLQVLPTKAMKI